MNIVQSLGEYVNKVLDTNGDGRITFGDFVGLFPNYAVAIAIIFIDVVVLAAEYRVWDVGYQMTGDPFKAVGRAGLCCAFLSRSDFLALPYRKFNPESYLGRNGSRLSLYVMGIRYG